MKNFEVFVWVLVAIFLAFHQVQIYWMKKNLHSLEEQIDNLECDIERASINFKNYNESKRF